jgi:soluble lytic murein transglycosylase-like protein
LLARGSSFLRIELLLALLAFPLFTAGCGPRQVWGIDAEELTADLARARYSSLANVDFSSQNPGDALSLSPEAPFYLSFVFDAMGRPEQSLRMLDLAWEKCPDPWKNEAGILLAQQLVRRKEYDRAIAVARRLAVPGGLPGREQRARRVLVEALYWSRDDAAALQEAVRLASPDPEVLLFRGVSSIRLQRAEAHDLIMQLFLTEKVSALHARAYTFIAAEPAYLQLFSEVEQNLLTGTYALTQGEWSKGTVKLEAFLSSAPPALIADSAVVANLGNAFLYGGAFLPGAVYMESLSSRLTGQSRIDALEQAGRLYRRAREYTRALAPLRLVARDAATPAQRDRAHWFIVDVVFAMNAPDLAAEIAADAVAWSDPAGFADLLRSRIAELVTARRWTTLEKLWSSLEASGPDEVRAQLSYVLARTWQEGTIDQLPGAMTATGLFRDAALRSPWGYYGILASSMLGDLPDRTVPAATAPDSSAPVDLDPLAMGYLRFGLTDKAFAGLWAIRDTLSDPQLMEAAHRFASAGDYRSSMYLVGVTSRRRRLSIPELELFYPRAYAELIDPLAAGTGLPDHIVYGLVREESYFDPDVVSSAGAIGLSQLMASTAAGVARGMKLVNPDLRDPTTNLTIGIRHLKDLSSNVSSMTKALLAYNAGLTRVRKWERAAPGLASDLFLETVPFAETRDYVRKILVSSVMYSFLYHDVDPRDAALSFFTLDPRKLDFGPGRSGPRQRPGR